MGIKRGTQSLQIIFFKYLFSVGLGLVLAAGVAISSFSLFINSKLVLPANYAEQIILKNKESIAKSYPFNQALLPEGTSYLLLSQDGKFIDTNMNESLKKEAKHFHQHDEILTPKTFFIEVKRPDGYVIINYMIEPHYANQWLEAHAPKVEILFGIWTALLCLLSGLFITVWWAKQISAQLAPMLQASQKIAMQDLDFKMGQSSIKEFNDVLNSLDDMKSALSESLRNNWMQEETRKRQISALTHDLKTPLAIAQGNAELLSDTELTQEQAAYVHFVVKNIDRISYYSQALIEMSQSDLTSINFKPIDTVTIAEKVKDVAREMASVHHFKLSELMEIDHHELLVDMNAFERAIQNVISNAVEHTEEAAIDIHINTTVNHLIIRVSDDGPGFTPEDLIKGTEPFYRGDKSRHSSLNYGLGLYSTKQIVTKHNGSLLLNNRENEKGAEVIIQLPLKS
ncbi:HAMP domain-containing sensor histidine kinase [Atopobacter phocae]|uniref:HAMP domain-containing sensor histidine kinase n=1 Tax=Atopobacter phocae TaxID=136492 RepID=UPI000472EA1B|nr:HAMP domain-containing sensor histidine kinase [Atopobacter phocae]